MIGMDLADAALAEALDRAIAAMRDEAVSPSPGVLALARHGKASVALSQVAGGPWARLVTHHRGSGFTHAMELVDTSESAIRLYGAAAAQPRRGPTIHYLLVKEAGLRAIRLSDTSGEVVWTTEVRDNTALLCLSEQVYPQDGALKHELLLGEEWQPL